MTNEQFNALIRASKIANLELLTRDDSMDGCTLSQITGALVAGLALTIPSLCTEKISDLDAIELVIDVANKARTILMDKQKKEGKA